MSATGGEGFKRISEELIFQGKLVSLARGTFEAPEGQRFQREVVHHPGAVVVIPMIDGDTALLVRQYRAAVNRPMLEVPAGKRDVPGEPPEETAVRELAEEIGRAAGSLELMARFYNSPGYCDEYTWAYLARDLTVVPHDRQGLEEEDMEVVEVRISELDRLVADGTLSDAKTIVGLSLAARRLAAG